MTILEIEQVSKVYRGGVRANDGITLTVQAGEVFGLLGPNGAGKTTLVNQIIGLVTPTAGSIRIGGVDALAHPAYARQACSFQPQSQVPIDGVTPLQAIELVGRLRGERKERVQARARQLIEALAIEEWAHQSGERLSGGVRRLTAFCMATVVPGQQVVDQLAHQNDTHDESRHEDCQDDQVEIPCGVDERRVHADQQQHKTAGNAGYDHRR